MKKIKAVKEEMKNPIKKWRKRQIKNGRNEQIPSRKLRKKKPIKQLKEMVQDLNRGNKESTNHGNSENKKLWVNYQKLQMQA